MAVLTPRAKPADPTETPSAIPPLENGDRLTRAEFERRYDAMPDLKKAELIEGEVYVGSPVRPGGTASRTLNSSAGVGIYAAGTPGLVAGDNGSIRLDLDNKPQPDVSR